MLEEPAMSYIDALIGSCETAKGAQPSKELEIDVCDLSPLAEIDRAIYIIEEVGGDPERTFLAFSRYKCEKKRACARLNAPSTVMYVGSSTTGLRRRIEEHMGLGGPGTYALHLTHWFQGKCRIVVRQYDVADGVLQIIEDALAHELKPAFGKRGANNK